MKLTILAAVAALMFTSPVLAAAGSMGECQTVEVTDADASINDLARVLYVGPDKIDLLKQYVVEKEGNDPTRLIFQSVAIYQPEDNDKADLLVVLYDLNGCSAGTFIYPYDLYAKLIDAVQF